jgi:hypothetical protein
MTQPYTPRKAQSVALTCGHDFWFRQFRPRPGDTIYCVKCEADSSVIRLHPDKATYYPDAEWLCYGRTQWKARGVCRLCQHEFTAAFKEVRTYMEKHHRSACQWTGETLVFNLVNLPPNSPPPF